MKLKKYSDYPPEIRRNIIIKDIIVNAFILVPAASVVFSLCGLNTAADIIKIAYMILISVGVIVLGVVMSVKAFRQKRIGAGIFLAFMSLTVPTVILLAATEKGRALILYILEGY